jgi:sensor histidine kinase YesM
MRNPILKNYKNRAVYAAVWTLVTAVEMVALYYFQFTGMHLLDVAVYHFTGAVLALLIWYPVYFNRKRNDNAWYNVLFVHLIVAVAFLAIWQAVGYVLMSLFTNGDEAYSALWLSSLLFRLSLGFLMYLIIALVYAIMIYVDQLKEKAENEIRLTEIIRDSELNLLKSQINPHFLFNSLNSVNSLILQNAEKAREMVVALSDFLRYTVLSTNQSMVSVESEVENVKRYLAIEKLRFGDKLAYHFEVSEEALQVKMPSMMLQPLFENAVKHGVCESLQTVQVWTKVEKREGYIYIEVSNDFEPGTSAKKGSGTGLKNIAERLRLLYHSNALIQVRKENERFSVTLQIPIR